MSLFHVIVEHGTAFHHVNVRARSADEGMDRAFVILEKFGVRYARILCARAYRFHQFMKEDKR